MMGKSFLGSYEPVVQNRAVRPAGSSRSSQSLLAVKKEENGDGAHEPRVKRAKPALYELHFVLIGKPETPKEELKTRIARLGGKLVTSIHEKIAAIISTKEEVEKFGKRMQDAQALDIQVVPESFLDAVEKSGDAIEKIKSMNISDWGSDPLIRIPKEEEKKPRQDHYTKNVPSKVTMKIKGGTAVDPDSNLEDIAHVYKQGQDLYCAVLGLTDIQTNTNKYYKLQLLESDKGHRYWVFRSWGRTGTSIGAHKLESFPDVEDAMENFEKLYFEKTKNSWYNRKNFVKHPGKYNPIEVDYDDSDKVKKLEEHSKFESKLPVAVQNLVKLLFDVEGT
jgi:poly [ADP-ribose] polymerase